MELPQTLLLVVIVILTIVLVVLGVQTFFLLMEARKTLVKTNKVLDEVKGGSNVLKAIGLIAPVILGRNLGKSVLSFLSKDKEEKPREIKMEDVASTEVKKSAPEKNVRRFFRRSR